MSINKDKNSYILIFAVIMTLVLGSVLAFTSESLKERQKAEVAFEQQKFILSSALGKETINTMSREEVKTMYESRVNDLVTRESGETLDGVTAKSVNVAKEYKKSPDKRQLPVYTIASENDPNTIEYYVFPLYGFGLWDNIWAYVALQSDLNTVQGAVFDHKGETPGLGARITEDEVQKRYTGKKLFESGSFMSVEMQKGENNDYDGQPHKVDGLSGATITGKGLNDMFNNYFGLYLNYINKQKGN